MLQSTYYFISTLDESLKEVQQTLNKIFDIEAAQPLEEINPKQKKMLEIKLRNRQKYLESLENLHKNKTKINKDDYIIDSHKRLIKKPDDLIERHKVWGIHEICGQTFGHF